MKFLTILGQILLNIAIVEPGRGLRGRLTCGSGELRIGLVPIASLFSGSSDDRVFFLFKFAELEMLEEA